MTDRGVGMGTAAVARRLGKSQREVQRLIETGALPAYRLGDRDLTIFESDLDAWIESRRVGGAA
ncbi:helix-turn-helix domain-containing protein [Mycobacterium frederiksbergense]|uniref:helix-turn-helix domain-containing protein n=1 Tax=Mycolicibacterium frederiksbergense TaxID=117567 RepID=UPI0021F2F9FB|nr:helix-turn-helix domain-containing protein [Mycolicibacterium frederiksbergense]MCV7043250.1 helix-turn-helix domain-containing protein [Mycolicibacterium frederiksbergense]